MNGLTVLAVLDELTGQAGRAGLVGDIGQRRFLCAGAVCCRVAGGAGWAALLGWATSAVLTHPANLKLRRIDYHGRLWFVSSPETVTPVRFRQKILIELKPIRVIKSVSEKSIRKPSEKDTGLPTG